MKTLPFKIYAIFRHDRSPAVLQITFESYGAVPQVQRQRAPRSPTRLFPYRIHTQLRKSE